MKKHAFRGMFFSAVFIFLIVLPVLAQAVDCPALVELALAELNENCGDLKRNTACYGFDRVDATFSEATDEGFFSLPSDRSELRTLQTIATAPLDVELERWGIAVMNVQANVPNSLPGQAVTFMLLGDVAVENAVAADAAFEGAEPIVVTTVTGSNLRSFASTNANIVGNAPNGTELPADGLSADGAWLRVLSDAGSAWISRALVSTDGDLDTLPTITNETRSPMQAFYFTTGFSEPSCNEVPPSTLLVQGPDNVKVDITANGADIRLGSTVGLRTENGVMQLFVIDGSAVVDGIVIPPGFTIFIPLSEDGQTPAGSWTGLRPLTAEELQEFQGLQQLGGDFLHYPLELPTFEDILALQAAITGGGGGNGGTVGNTTSGPAAGLANCAGFIPTSPLGAMPFETISFYWDPAPGATNYRVNVFNAGGGLVYTTQTGGAETSIPVNAASLGVGDSFSWQVEALVDGEAACATGLATFVRGADPNIPTPSPLLPFSASWACSGLYYWTVYYDNLPAGDTSVSISFVTSPPSGNGGTFGVPPFSRTFSGFGPVNIHGGTVTSLPSGTTYPIAGALSC